MLESSNQVHLCILCNLMTTSTNIHSSVASITWLYIYIIKYYLIVQL